MEVRRSRNVELTARYSFLSFFFSLFHLSVGCLLVLLLSSISRCLGRIKKEKSGRGMRRSKLRIKGVKKKECERKEEKKADEFR